MADPAAALAALVAADPLDGPQLRALARALAASGDRALAAKAFALAARACAEAGQLALGAVAAKQLGELDPAKGAEVVQALAAAYGRGSARTDETFRPRPPKAPDPARAPSLPPADPESALAAAEQALAARAETPLPRIALFSGLGPDSFAKLVALAQVVEADAGKVVVDVGQPGSAFYVVARGTVRITRPDLGGGEAVLSHLRAGAFFGEMALLTDSPRAARATCDSPCVLLEVPRRGLSELADAEPELAAVLAAYTRDRLLANLMLTSGLFAPLDEQARRRLVERFTLRVLAPGAVLLEEGQPGGELQVVLSGSVQVEKRDGAETLVVTRLGPGDVVGEISLLTRRPCTATVRARERVHVLALPRDDFNAIAQTMPGILAHLYQLANERERDLERFLADAVVEADDYLI